MPQVPGITLSADRAGGDTGVVIRIRTVAERLQGDGRGWNHCELVRVARDNLLGSSGASSYEHLQDADAYDAFRRAYSEALSRPLDEPLEAIISVVQEQ